MIATELKLKNGDYVPETGGDLYRVSGTEELVQRALMRLAARRGGFAPLPDYGSRLHTLGRIRPSQREAAAWQFALEALAPETEIALTALEYLPGDDGSAVLRLALDCGGEKTAAVLRI